MAIGYKNDTSTTVFYSWPMRSGSTYLIEYDSIDYTNSDWMFCRFAYAGGTPTP